MKVVKLSIFILCVSLLQGCTYYFGNSWTKKFPEYSTTERLPFSTELRERHAAVNPEQHPLVHRWADKEVNGWNLKNKTGSPRVMLAKLVVGKDVEQVNKFIAESVPWGKSGSTGPLYKKGDYDFTQITLCSILYLFGDNPEKLYHTTVDRLVNVLMIEEGGKPKYRTPRTLKVMKDTENHILMTETTRYLKNQWLKNHGSTDKKHDNKANGLEKFWVHHLEEMLKTGMYEFNAQPYEGYTLAALMTLHAFAETPEIVRLSQEILDYVNYCYAYGSYDFRRCVPFRRRLERAGKTELGNEAHTALMKTWIKESKGELVTGEEFRYGDHHALIALLTPYELPKEIIDLTLKQEGEYLVKIGHGYKASPEVHSVGDNYLLSAGGVQRGRVSQIVARPTVLLLNDEEADYKNCFHLQGKGEMKEWNNTGVYHQFACSNAPVAIPERYKAVAEQGGWQVFKPYEDDDLLIAVFNKEDLGLLAIFSEWQQGAESLAKQLAIDNPQEDKLYAAIKLPNGTTINYDLKARKKQWVIESVNGISLDRNFDFWPRLKKEQALKETAQ